MVVALGTTDRHSQESARNSFDRGDRELLIRIRPRSCAASQKTQCKQVFRSRFDRRKMSRRRYGAPFGGAVAEDLRSSKFIVGQVTIQRGDNPLAPKINSRRRWHVVIDVRVSQQV